MADIVSRIPFALSGRSDVSAANFVRSRDMYDFALGGIPLLSKIDDQHPYVRGLAPIRKDQFDNQQIPGEQSLTGWWLRSQSTFIGGEGLLFQDPIQSRFGNEYGIRYGSGYGVNPWVDGKLTLLKRTSQQKSAASANVYTQGFVSSGTNYYWHANTNTLTRIDAAGTNTAVTWGGAANIQTLTNSGDKYYVASTEGIYRGTNAAAGTKLWNNTDGTTTYTTFVLGYAKQRLMCAANNAILELGADPAAPPVNLPAPKYIHPNANFVWTGFAEGTNAIYAAGHDGYRGYIYKFTLSDSTGGLPALTSGILAATLPDGETLLSIYTYLGAFVGLGTSRGMRVGQIDTNGDLQYGPLLFEISGGVNCITGYDRFMWAGATNSVNGKSGLYRVDLGQPIQVEGGSPSIRFAYATDLSTQTTGTVTSVTSIGTLNQRVIGVNSAGSYLEHATEFEAVGRMTTGRVRFNTLENKLYKFMSIRTPDPAIGTLSVSTVDKTGNAVSMITYGTTAPGGNDVAIASPQGPQEYISLQFDMTRGASPTIGCEMNAWQIKAVPGVIRQRIITMSFLMFDYETDKTGQKLGYAGRTANRLRQIEEMAQVGDALQFQDLSLSTTDLVFVEEMEFQQLSSPGKGYPVAEYGGVLTVKLRTVADNITVD